MKAQAIIDALMGEPRLYDGKRSDEALVEAGFPIEENGALWTAIEGRADFWQRRGLEQGLSPAVAIGGAFIDGLLIGLRVAREAASDD